MITAERYEKIRFVTMLIAASLLIICGIAHGQQPASYVGPSQYGNVYMSYGPNPTTYIAPAPFHCPVLNWVFAPRVIYVLPQRSQAPVPAPQQPN